MFCLGAGIVLNHSIKKALIYPFLIFFITTLFIFFRVFSNFYGILIYAGLLVLCYVLYWYNWWLLSKKRKKPKRYLPCIIWTALSVLSLIVFLCFSVSVTGYKIYHIPTYSMMPTLRSGDYVLVDLWYYKRNLVNKRDVIVFQHPYKNRTYIKRIIYMSEDQFLGSKLKPNNYAVIGDNINNSEDSRVFGPIHHELLLGKAELIIFPLNIKDNYFREIL